MATTDFLPFGTGGSAPVLTQAAYASLPPSAGFGAGLLPKEYINKALRQSSVIAAMIGNFMVAQGQNANDDGNLTTLGANFVAALQAHLGQTVQMLSTAGVPDGFQIGTLIVQVAQFDFSDIPSGQPGATGAIVYPHALTTACLGIFPGFRVASGGAALNNFQFAIAGTPGLTSANFQIQEWSSGVNPGHCSVIVIGY